MEYYDEVVEIKKNSEQIETNNEPGILAIDEDIPSVSGQSMDVGRRRQDRPISSLVRKKSIQKIESFGSESESSDSEPKDSKGFILNHKEWDDLDVSHEIKEIFQYILRYTPPKIDLDYNLQPFIPDYIPAVGDIDAFLKVHPPPKPPNEKLDILDHIEQLGLVVLDEPCGQQSDPALLHMRLRSVSTQPRTPGPPPSVSKSMKDIEKWIAEVQMLQINQPYPMVINSKPMQDIDALMIEWPNDMEKTLNNLGLPNANLNCSLKFYIELMCSLMDIPIPNTKNQADYILALHTLFNLYIAVKSSV